MTFLTLITCFGLLLAFLPMPLSYYTLLRFLVCACAVLGFRRALKLREPFWPLSYAAMAVLFNPLFPIYLRQKSTWLVVDAIAIVFLLAAARVLRREPMPRSAQGGA